MKALRILMAPVALAAIVGVSQPAATAEVDLTNNMYAAIYAEEMCGGVDFSQDDWERMVVRIDAMKAAGDTAGDALMYVEGSQEAVLMLRHKYTCQSEQIDALRATYAANFAGA